MKLETCFPVESYSKIGQLHQRRTVRLKQPSAMRRLFVPEGSRSAQFRTCLFVTRHAAQFFTVNIDVFAGVDRDLSTSPAPAAISPPFETPPSLNSRTRLASPTYTVPEAPTRARYTETDIRTRRAHSPPGRPGTLHPPDTRLLRWSRSLLHRTSTRISRPVRTSPRERSLIGDIHVPVGRAQRIVVDRDTHPKAFFELTGAGPSIALHAPRRGRAGLQLRFRFLRHTPTPREQEFAPRTEPIHPPVGRVNDIDITDRGISISEQDPGSHSKLSTATRTHGRSGPRLRLPSRIR